MVGLEERGERSARRPAGVRMGAPRRPVQALEASSRVASRCFLARRRAAHAAEETSLAEEKVF